MMRHSLLIIVTPFVRASYYTPQGTNIDLKNYQDLRDPFNAMCLDIIADDFKSLLYEDIDTKLKTIEQHVLLDSNFIPNEEQKNKLETWVQSYSFITDGKSPVDVATEIPSDVNEYWAGKINVLEKDKKEGVNALSAILGNNISEFLSVMMKQVYNERIELLVLIKSWGIHTRKIDEAKSLMHYAKSGFDVELTKSLNLAKLRSILLGIQITEKGLANEFEKKRDSLSNKLAMKVDGAKEEVKPLVDMLETRSENECHIPASMELLRLRKEIVLQVLAYAKKEGGGGFTWKSYYRFQ